LIPAESDARETRLQRLQQLGALVFIFGFDLLPVKQAHGSPAAVTALAEKRWAAKAAKDFAAADALRKELAAAGWAMLDGKDGYKLV